MLFDLDGTLVDTAPDLATATNYVMRHMGLPEVDEQEILPFVGRGAIVMIRQAAESHGRPITPETQKECFAIFNKHYADNIANRSKPYDGILSLLPRLKSQGHELAICTNKFESNARLLLDKLDLSHFFPVLTGGNTFEFRKPDPRHITETILMAKGRVDRAVMIGDSETDIKAAKAAGVPVVAVNFGYSDAPVETYEPDIIISHFSELESALEQLGLNS